jgi:hypothetical protein
MKNSKQSGSIFYLVCIIITVLAAVAGLVMDRSREEAFSTQMVYRSEVAVNISEAIIDEFFYNVEKIMNNPEKGKLFGGIYESLRAKTVAGEIIRIDEKEIPTHLAPQSLTLCKKMNEGRKVPVCEAWVHAAIRDISPINVNPTFKDSNGKTVESPGIIPDPYEKNATLEVRVEVNYEGYSKKLAVTKGVKVVNCTVQPLAPFTMFINQGGFPYYAKWASKYGMAYHNESKPEKEAKTIMCDHGWGDALGKGQVSRDELLQAFEEEFMPGNINVGRVFLNTGVVPVTNGNLEAGMLQKAFFSAESELLPPFSIVDVEDKNTFLQKVGHKMSSEEKTILKEKLPDSGKLYTRYIGHGAEVRNKKVTVNTKERVGFSSYFESVKGEWGNGTDYKNPSISGLDLFGRVEFKPGVLDKEKDQKTGIFGQILNLAKEVTRSVINAFVDDNYNLRVSPTLVYGKAFMSYFQVMDYKYTRAGKLKDLWKKKKEQEREDKGFWSTLWGDIKDLTDKMLRSVVVGVMGPGQCPLPIMPADFLQKMSSSQIDKALEKTDLQNLGWSEEAIDSFLDLPEGLRTPRFYQFIEKMREAQLEFFGTNMRRKIPAGAVVAPYNNAIMNYLKPPTQGEAGKLVKFVSDEQKSVAAIAHAAGAGSGFFMDNTVCQELSNKWGVEYKSPFEGILDSRFPLANFNPFLYYRKATDYVSSIYDFRSAKEKSPKANSLRKKYYDEKEKVLDLNGIIYITGTADPLKFSDFLPEGADKNGVVEYKGKAIIITFGEIVFDCSVRKKGYQKDEYKALYGKEAPLLTVVALGGVSFKTPQVVQATIYSFMYPPRSNYEFKLHGTFGASELDLSYLPMGGVVKYDPSYAYWFGGTGSHNEHYYWASISDELKKYSWKMGWEDAE